MLTESEYTLLTSFLSNIEQHVETCAPNRSEHYRSGHCMRSIAERWERLGIGEILIKLEQELLTAAREHRQAT